MYNSVICFSGRNFRPVRHGGFSAFLIVYFWCLLVFIGFYWFAGRFSGKSADFFSWRNFRPVRHGSFAAVRIGYSLLSVFMSCPVGSPGIPRNCFRGVISVLSDMAALRLCGLVFIGFY